MFDEERKKERVQLRATHDIRQQSELGNCRTVRERAIKRMVKERESRAEEVNECTIKF